MWDEWDCFRQAEDVQGRQLVNGIMAMLTVARLLHEGLFAPTELDLMNQRLCAAKNPEALAQVIVQWWNGAVVQCTMCMCGAGCGAAGAGAGRSEGRVEAVGGAVTAPAEHRPSRPAGAAGQA